ncbi:MAG: hypothetical protein IPK60_17035 [Sandaracinaceae bacterium]|nr:hypothetical protein [Sandaracinaceae bacterium]
MTREWVHLLLILCAMQFAGCFAAHELTAPGVEADLRIAITTPLVPNVDFVRAQMFILRVAPEIGEELILASFETNFSGLDAPNGLRDQIVGSLGDMPSPGEYEVVVRLTRADDATCDATRVRLHLPLRTETPIVLYIGGNFFDPIGGCRPTPESSAASLGI